MLTLIGIVAAAIAVAVVANWRLHFFRMDVLDEVAKANPPRAKDNQGRFVADNPATPENEAWAGGEAPAKKVAPRKTSARKPTAKKAPAKK